MEVTKRSKAARTDELGRGIDVIGDSGIDSDVLSNYRLQDGDKER